MLTTEEIKSIVVDLGAGKSGIAGYSPSEGIGYLYLQGMQEGLSIHEREES